MKLSREAENLLISTATGVIVMLVFGACFGTLLLLVGSF